MGSAPVSASLMEAIHRALPKAKVTNAYGTTEAGPGGVRPASEGTAAAGELGRLSASEGAASPGRRRQPQRRAGRAGDEMPGADERLSQPAGRAAAVHRRTASTSPATCSAATRTASTISSAAPTTCSSPAARTSIRPTSSACWRSIPMSRRPWWCRSTTTSRARSRSPSSSRRPAAARPRTRSRNTRWPTRRPISTRASSGSSTNCRSPRPTRSTAGALQLAQERVAAAQVVGDRRRVHVELAQLLRTLNPSFLMIGVQRVDLALPSICCAAPSRARNRATGSKPDLISSS